MASGKFVSYIRVSTAEQGRSGLGLEAQKASIMNYLNGGPWALLKEFIEIESGKNKNRPELDNALKLCQLTGATLIIAKLDRLSRNIHFITSLMEAGIDFVACDMPQASRFTIHIYAALAEQERVFISERTKAALKAAQDRGVELGTNNLTDEGRRKGAHNAAMVRLEKAKQFAAKVSPVIDELRSEGKSLREIAKELNSMSIQTARSNEDGKGWTAMKVKAILDRMVD